MSNDLLVFTKKGIYCPEADIYIDPWKPVQKALITHGHSDHARYGHKQYICQSDTVPIIKHRLGQKISAHGVPYEENLTINGVKFSFHPAGHLIGSAQIRVEHQGEVWVASGDYKTYDDNISTAFAPVRCHTFITESTFGVPIYQWQPLETTIEKINAWWTKNQSDNRPSILTAYSLGKAQSILHNIDKSIGPIYCHGAIQKMNKVLREAKLFNVETLAVTDSVKDYSRALILTPPSGLNSNWSKRFKNASTASASGWMMLRGMRRRRSVDNGFVLSDHADWKGLLGAIADTGAARVIVTHGYQDIFTSYLSEQGYEAQSEKTLFEGENAEAQITAEQNPNLKT